MLRKWNVVDVADFLNKKKFTVLFSGGKDSTAALLWILDHINHGNWNILYVEVTGNTHPLCTRYVVELCEELDLESKLIIGSNGKYEFFECLRRWGVPIIGKYRWCMYNFKIKVIKKYARGVQVTGVKRSDSHMRRKREKVEFFKLTKTIAVNPLANWSTKQVLNYLKEHNIRLNPCYKLYCHSGNCMFCPYHSKKQIIRTLQDPEWRNKILNSLKHGKGRISREKYNLWMKWKSQTTLIGGGSYVA